MAALYPDTFNKRILVKNLPSETNSAKLTIYFQRRKNGGLGDVESVTYPKSKSEIDQAIVEFEDFETVKSVLRHSPHVINGQHLDVTEFPEQALGHTTVVVSETVRSKLSQISNALSELEESAGVKVSHVNNSLTVSGQWYQVMAAADMIDGMIKDSTGTQTSVQIQNTLSQGTVDLPQVDAGARSVEENMEDFTEVKVDSNVLLFFKKSHSSFVPTLLKKYKVAIEEDESKVVFRTKKSSASGKSDTENAANDFNQRYMKFADSIRKEYIDVKNLPGSPSQDDIDRAVDEIMGLKKNFFIFVEEKSGKNGYHLVFLAMSKRDCENGVDEFRCFFIKNKKLLSLTLDRTSTKVVVIYGDFRKETSGALISEIDESGTGMVVSAGGESANKAVKKARGSKIIQHPVDDRDGKCNLQCKSIIHYILDPLDSEIDFEKSVADCLELANKQRLKRITLPMNCLGAGMDNKTVCKSIFSVISRLASIIAISRSTLQLSEIRIIHSDEAEAQKLVKCFSRITTASSVYEANSMSSGAKKKLKTKNSSEEEEKDVCAVCLDDFLGAMATKTLPCKHNFHKVCIEKALKISNKCPICMRFYGNATGNMPKGTMRPTTDSLRLPGFNCDTIVINYQFPDGVQGPEHPNPGQRYRGTSRMAYLPNNKEGREILLLLRKAFDARLTFTVGQSVTTGMNNVVTWNDIHHKTTTHGGPTGFGYPDPGYLTRLKQELADKGITN